MKILYFSCHSVLEYDELRLLTALGHDVFALGGYVTPHAPHDPKRPAIPEMTDHPELRVHVDAMNAPDNLDAAKVNTPQALIDWADAIIVNGYEWRWLHPQWARLRDKRVIWRTIGQSLEPNERLMAPLFRDGLEIVRYSPRERNLPGFAGETTVIRFGKDPDDWHGWTGERPLVLNVTQHLRQRDPATNWRFWHEATRVLPGTARPYPVGPGSEVIHGSGEVTPSGLHEMLRTCRCYLYTGTQPASYTLGLIEALMTGCPVVSIGPGHMAHPDLFEGHELAGMWSDDPAQANSMLRDLLSSEVLARNVSESQREKAIRLFGFDTIRDQWRGLLGDARSMTVSVSVTQSVSVRDLNGSLNVRVKEAVA